MRRDPVVGAEVLAKPAPPASRRLAAVLLVALLATALVGCGGSSSPSGDTGAQPSDDPTASGTSDLYDVGGHKLYMSCEGDGPVTVVYVHGWINDTASVPHKNAAGIRYQLKDDFRVCLYDRRNVGGSDSVDAVQTPADMLHDMESVLSAGGAEPPYILLAASFGGLVASAYLSEHPDDVVGMVLMDTMFPDELRLDRYLPRQHRFVHFREDDMCCTRERIAQLDLIRSLQGDIGQEPGIPVIYLASEQEPRTKNDYGSPEYDDRILDAQAAYVDRFSPGILRWVDAPHFMEPVVPELIADAVREVDQLGHS
jgi:pimeloyl-ACP methyl ester carboxylesterase